MRDNRGDQALSVLGTAIVICIALYYIIPVLFSGISQLVEATGTAVNLIVVAIVGGTAAGVTVSPWITTTTVVGIGGITIVSTLNLVVKASREVRKDPIAWTAPLLAIAAGFFTDFAKEFYPGTRIVKVFFAVLTGLLVLVGGHVFSFKGWKCKFMGVAIQLLCPLFALAYVLALDVGKPVEETKSVSIQTWFALSGLFIIVILSAFLTILLDHRRLKNPDE